MPKWLDPFAEGREHRFRRGRSLGRWRRTNAPRKRHRRPAGAPPVSGASANATPSASAASGQRHRGGERRGARMSITIWPGAKRGGHRPPSPPRPRWNSAGTAPPRPTLRATPARVGIFRRALGRPAPRSRARRGLRHCLQARAFASRWPPHAGTLAPSPIQPPAAVYRPAPSTTKNSPSPPSTRPRQGRHHRRDILGGGHLSQRWRIEHRLIYAAS